MSGERVLLLDDAEMVRTRVRRALDTVGLDLVATDSWVDAKNEVFSARPPDLLILDLQMPTIDGAAVGRAIRRRMDIAIVVFSSEAQERTRQAAESIGAAAALSKSVTDQELVSTVLRVLGSRKLLAGRRAAGSADPPRMPGPSPLPGKPAFSRRFEEKPGTHV